MANDTVRPDFVTEDMLIYLDRLRASGKTNMFGAGAYVEKKFHLQPRDTRSLVLYWMATFSTRQEESES